MKMIANANEIELRGGEDRDNYVREELENASVRLFGYKFSILFANRILERFNVTGQTDFYNRNILLEANLTPGEMLSSVLHELIEIIDRHLLLKLDHDTLSRLEAGLFEVLVTNPILLELLLHYASSLDGVNDQETT